MGVAVNNSVRGKIQWYAEQARDITAANIGVMLLQAPGLETDDALNNYPNLGALLASTNDEATFTNYARKILPNPTITVDNTLNRVVLGISGAAPQTIQWSNAGGSGAAVNNTVRKIVYYYEPASGTPDTGLIWLTAADVSAVTDGTHLVVTVDPNDGWHVYESVTG